MVGFKDRFALAKMRKVPLLMGKKLISICPPQFSARKSGRAIFTRPKARSSDPDLDFRHDCRSVGGGSAHGSAD